MHKNQPLLLTIMNADENKESFRLIALLMLVLVGLPNDILTILDTQNLKYFVMFITHVFRLLLVMKQVDQVYDVLTKNSKQQLQAILQLVKIKFSSYSIAFPKNKLLVEKLLGDTPLIHAKDVCLIQSFYLPEPNHKKKKDKDKEV